MYWGRGHDVGHCEGEVSTVTRYVYTFGDGRADGDAGMRDLLGGKGANVAEMTRIQIPVPPGFTITTEVCTWFMQHDGGYPEGLREQVDEAMRRVESIMGARFGDAENPLLVSVRSGARVSMPGMMDTVLNLGLNDATVRGLMQRTGNARFAWDSYRRFIQMYGDVVMGIHTRHFEERLARARRRAGVETDPELGADVLEALVAEYKAVVREHAGEDFPQDPDAQLWGAIAAVFRSWDSPRAVSYRRMNGYPDDWGTAVNVQAMVFGNMGDDCATGVAFTRNPATGEKHVYGEYLVNAQGEDVVAGIRTPQPITGGEGSLERRMPDVYRQLLDVFATLERHYRDMQDIEFTIQAGRLWILQTRNGKRTGRAAIRIAVDLVDEGLIDEETAIERVEPRQLEQLLHPMIDPSVQAEPIATGLPASPGAASGHVVFRVEDAVRRADAGEDVILVRTETSPEDIDGMKVARAILTSRGGMTSHAAVVARGMGTCCVVGCSDLEVDEEAGVARAGGATIRAGDEITVEGTTGRVYCGRLPTVDPELDATFERFMRWVDARRRLRVRANADTPEDAAVARRFGAQGIGLCRTEHMFFGEDRIDVVRRMIMAESRDERLAALREILPMQREDFVGVLRAMDGFPVTIRLLDPPLHEFLPHDRDAIAALAARIGMDVDRVSARVHALAEFNPMLGHRGCRLGITYPEIYEIQTRAIIEAALGVRRDGVEVHPEIMIPLVGTRDELAFMRRVVEDEVRRVLDEQGETLDVLVGTMIEVPRAAVTASEVAQVADFFSFGTNDLTQMTYGFSRDDAVRFITVYLEAGILPADPFQTLDVPGVGALIRMACEGGRATRPELHLGVCGEHGGDPESVRFFERIGLDYVSCSPYRVPVARLAAAQAARAAGSSPAASGDH